MARRSYSTGDLVTWKTAPRGIYGPRFPIRGEVVKVASRRVCIRVLLKTGTAVERWVQPYSIAPRVERPEYRATRTLAQQERDEIWSRCEEMWDQELIIQLAEQYRVSPRYLRSYILGRHRRRYSRERKDLDRQHMRDSNTDEFDIFADFGFGFGDTELDGA